MAEISKTEKIKEVLKKYEYPFSDAEDLEATLNHTKLKVTESNKCECYSNEDYLAFIIIFGLYFIRD